MNQTFFFSTHPAVHHDYRCADIDDVLKVFYVKCCKHLRWLCLFKLILPAVQQYYCWAELAVDLKGHLSFVFVWLISEEKNLIQKEWRVASQQLRDCTQLDTRHLAFTKCRCKVGEQRLRAQWPVMKYRRRNKLMLLADVQQTCDDFPFGSSSPPLPPMDAAWSWLNKHRIIRKRDFWNVVYGLPQAEHWVWPQ